MQANPTPQSGAVGGHPAPEVIVTPSTRVACDGGGGALGHPKVWYDMGEDDFVECKYCDRLYVLKGGSRDPEK